jgi:DNA-binding NtrC family response regulator
MAKKAMRFEFEVVALEEVPQKDAATVGKDLRPFVLIVDDERIIADTLSIILAKSGYQVMTAYDGSTALGLANRNQPDLLLTDVAMPGMTGIELAIEVTETLPGCKVLLFSGHASTVDALEEVRRQGYDFNLLTKPVHPSDMLRRISECLEFREFAGNLTSQLSSMTQ